VLRFAGGVRPKTARQIRRSRSGGGLGYEQSRNGSTLQTDASVTIRPLILILLNGLAHI
jgi:hypothetical protein